MPPGASCSLNTFFGNVPESLSGTLDELGREFEIAAALTKRSESSGYNIVPLGRVYGRPQRCCRAWTPASRACGPDRVADGSAARHPPGREISALSDGRSDDVLDRTVTEARDLDRVTAPVRFGLKLGGQDVTADEMRAVWQIADEAGFDHLWCLDLFMSIGPGGPDRPIFEGWALQAAMAAATTRVRIGCTFTGNTHRPPWMLAKLAVTVDHLSGGRLEFGIGAGYEENEHRM